MRSAAPAALALAAASAALAAASAALAAASLAASAVSLAALAVSLAAAAAAHAAAHAAASAALAAASAAAIAAASVRSVPSSHRCAHCSTPGTPQCGAWLVTALVAIRSMATRCPRLPSTSGRSSNHTLSACSMSSAAISSGVSPMAGPS